MDNICFEKIWQDDSIIEVKISASCEYVSAYQNCYIQDVDLKKNAEKICEYVKDFKKSCCLDFGKKENGYTSAFSMHILPASTSGHMQIEVDLEIEDNKTRAHRCCFYVASELGLLMNFGYSLKRLVTCDIGEKVELSGV